MSTLPVTRARPELWNCAIRCRRAHHETQGSIAELHVISRRRLEPNTVMRHPRVFFPQPTGGDEDACNCLKSLGTANSKVENFIGDHRL